jgi:hypothetical protein
VPRATCVKLAADAAADPRRGCRSSPSATVRRRDWPGTPPRSSGFSRVSPAPHGPHRRAPGVCAADPASRHKPTGIRTYPQVSRRTAGPAATADGVPKLPANGHFGHAQPSGSGPVAPPLKIVVSSVRFRVSPSRSPCKWACFEIVIAISAAPVWESRHKPRHKPLTIVPCSGPVGGLARTLRGACPGGKWLIYAVLARRANAVVSLESKATRAGIVMPTVRFPGRLTEFYRVYAISINSAKPRITRLGSISGAGGAGRCVCVGDSLGKWRRPVAEHLPREVVQLERQRSCVRIRQLRRDALRECSRGVARPEPFSPALNSNEVPG